jgi:hypothetical protein
MIKTSIEKFAKDIGFDIGCSDDNIQSDLLNGFCKGLSNSMDSHSLGTQLCYIVDKLDSKSEKVLLELLNL